MTALAARQEVVPLTGGKVSLLLLGPLSDWMRPPTLGRTICFTQSADLNVNLIQKHFHRHTLNNVWPNIWVPHGPVQLAHKINHHIMPSSGSQGPAWVSRSFIHFIHSTNPCTKEIEVKEIFQNAYRSWLYLCGGISVGTGFPFLWLSSMNMYALLLK